MDNVSETVAGKLNLEVASLHGKILALEMLLEKEKIVRKKAEELLADMAAPILRGEHGMDVIGWANSVREYFTPEYFDEQFLGKGKSDDGE